MAWRIELTPAAARELRKLNRQVVRRIGAYLQDLKGPQNHLPAKRSWIDLRATQDDRDLLDRAAAALGTDRSSFLLAQGRLAAQRALTDREHFLLDAGAQQEWERRLEQPSPLS